MKPLVPALAALALALSAPGLAVAQSAGDEQYEDPIVSEPDRGGGSGDVDPGSRGDGTGSPGDGPDTPVESPAEPTAPAPDAGDLPPGAEPALEQAPATATGSETLPLTGVDAGVLALCGLMLLAAGALLARRLAIARG